MEKSKNLPSNQDVEPSNLEELFEKYNAEERNRGNGMIGLLKELYGDNNLLKDLIYKDNPFLKIIKK